MARGVADIHLRAMPNFNDPLDFRKLTSAVAWSEKKLGEFRKDRMEALREYCGYHYGENSTDDKRPINTIQVGTTVYHRKISVKNPQALVTTRYRDLLASAEDFKLALNRRLVDMQIDAPLNEAGLDAMFCCGMVEVGVDEDTLEPFVESVLFEDVIIDMAAANDGEIGYIGHRFRAPLEWVRENDDFAKEVRLKATGGESQTAFGTASKDEKSQTIAIGEGRVEEYKEFVELIQLYCPMERVIVTYLAEHHDAPLKVKEWNGPPRSLLGPYRKLAFIKVPGSIMPVGVVQFWRDVHDCLNILANKTFRQAERQKTITTVPGESDADGKRMTEAGDGDAVGVSADPEKIKEKRFGGADQINLGMVMWLQKEFEGIISGGVGMLGGLGPGSDTVGQDQMLLQSAGSQVEDMQRQMLDFAKVVIEDVAWWLWTDPIGKTAISRTIPHLNEPINYDWDASRRKGDFFQYNFDVEPYSISVRTPQQRLGALLQMIQGVVAPMLPGMQQAGMTIDYERLIKTAADYADLPELGQMVIYQSGETMPAQGPTQDRSPKMRPNTTRKYVRENRSGGPGRESELMHKLLSATAGGGGGGG